MIKEFRWMILILLKNVYRRGPVIVFLIPLRFPIVFLLFVLILRYKLLILIRQSDDSVTYFFFLSLLRFFDFVVAFLFVLFSFYLKIYLTSAI